MFIGWDGPQGSIVGLTLETSVPIVFVKQRKIGSCVPTLKAYQEGRLQKLLKVNGSEALSQSCDYDIIIIGGAQKDWQLPKGQPNYNRRC